MIQVKPIHDIKLNVNKTLLTVLVNYFIISIINNLPYECDLIQNSHKVL